MEAENSKNTSEENMDVACEQTSAEVEASKTENYSRPQDSYSSERFKIELSNLGKFSYGVRIWIICSTRYDITFNKYINEIFFSTICRICEDF